jgi:ATP-dependent metalloprotease
MDKVSETKKNLEARIDVCMGGKVAEQLIYGEDGVSTGASSDIQQATNLAYHMVTQAGMSDLLGNIDLSSNYNRLSTDTKQKIESEVRRIIEAGKDRATKLLTEKRVELDRLATALVEYETLDKKACNHQDCQFLRLQLGSSVSRDAQLRHAACAPSRQRVS